MPSRRLSSTEIDGSTTQRCRQYQAVSSFTQARMVAGQSSGRYMRPLTVIVALIDQRRQAASLVRQRPPGRLFAVPPRLATALSLGIVRLYASGDHHPRRVSVGGGRGRANIRCVRPCWWSTGESATRHHSRHQPRRDTARGEVGSVWRAPCQL